MQYKCFSVVFLFSAAFVCARESCGKGPDSIAFRNVEDEWPISWIRRIYQAAGTPPLFGFLRCRRAMLCVTHRAAQPIVQKYALLALYQVFGRCGNLQYPFSMEITHPVRSPESETDFRNIQITTDGPPKPQRGLHTSRAQRSFGNLGDVF